jgi:hypothetical protein
MLENIELLYNSDLATIAAADLVAQNDTTTLRNLPVGQEILSLSNSIGNNQEFILPFYQPNGVI